MDAEVTRARIAHAAVGLFSNRVRGGECPFLKSHRDGICDRCRQMAAHDAELAARSA